MKKVLWGAAALVLFGASWAWSSYQATRPRSAAGTLETVERNGARIAYYTSGEGPLVLLLPSLGRGASDFNELAATLNGAGYRTAALEPRGMGKSTGGGAKGLTLHDLALDVEAVAERERRGRPVFVLGHAFGNRVARTYASDFPEKVAGTILLAAGGKVPIEPRIERALRNCFKVWMPDSWRRREIRLAFFAGSNPIPEHWMRGWNGWTARLQAAATRATPAEEWWHGGTAPLLVVQAMEDRIAPFEHTAALLEEELGERVTVARIRNAGHALLPERPAEVEEAVIDFLDGLRTRRDPTDDRGARTPDPAPNG